MYIRHIQASLFTLATCFIAGGTLPSVANAAEAQMQVDMMTESKAAKQTLNAPYDAFLAEYVVEQGGINLVAYDRVTSEDKAALVAYINTLSELDISGFSEAETLAYWFNLYNAKTIEVILDEYPIKSILKIGFRGPWKRKILKVRGEKLSLDNIEHDIVRATYKEPRVHFAFNCASIGCPNLKTSAWEAESLEADLTQAAIDYISSPRGVTITQDGKLVGSSLFKWYSKDFGQSDTDVLRYLSQFASGSLKDQMQTAKDFDDFDYDWNLNIAD
ncbi:uncharacterized protein DUF547 [Litorimonas taeanensis]|uniref:Uncharacterized protein DUF547 n=1 Tax=Litorimonas taeanensis TaxID=568099 RepID=A0A420WMG6_9PROT|nr:DUF547 domain-containing protein [Litorimonas taeanensis]RKQ72214.1 uncharacterized protein DUF547 [Litorimonas taeanensis]